MPRHRVYRAAAVYRVLLRLYPPAFRERFASPMADAFIDAYGRAHRTGHRATLRLWGYTIRDVAVHSARERILTLRPATLLRHGVLMETIVADIRYAVRTLAKAPGFTAVAIATLAIGVGANTAMFSVVNGVLLRPLPFDRPEELVAVWDVNRNTGNNRASVALPNFADWRDRNGVFAGLAATVNWNPTLTGFGSAERLQGSFVTEGIFATVLGVRPHLGRFFEAGDFGLNAPPVTLVGHELWQRRLGGDENIVGSTIDLSGTAFTVVGVMPPAVRLPHRPDAELWRPTNFDLRRDGWRGAHFAQVIGRVIPGVDFDRAQADMSTIAAQLEVEHANENTGYGVNIVPLHRDLVGSVRDTLFVLLGAVGFVLLLACANVANLMLARSSARRNEFAVRAALGAGRGRIGRQMVTESLVLALAGGALGIGAAYWGVSALMAVDPASLPRADQVGLDGVAMGFTLGLTILTGLAFGIIPALETASGDVAASIKETTRSGGGRRALRLRRVLVTVQVALSLALLVGAGLLTKSVRELLSQQLGFDAAQLVTARVALNSAYDGPDDMTQFAEALLTDLSGHPDVQLAAISSYAPFSDYGVTSSFTIEGRPKPPPAEEPMARVVAVTPTFFDAAGITLLTGRTFTNADRLDAPGVAVINRSAADRYFSGEDPIGQRIDLGLSFTVSEEPREIVGVVADTRYRSLAKEPEPQVFEPFHQQPNDVMNVLLRTRGRPEAFVDQLRAVVHNIDQDLAIYEARSLTTAVRGSVASERFVMLLASVFAGAALMLAAVGVYGVLSYGISQRTREMGLRLAFGARSIDVIALVVREGIALVAAGLVLGVGLAFLVGKGVRAMLFQVDAHDPLTIIVMVATMLVVSLAACLAPARRATRVQPMQALRTE